MIKDCDSFSSCESMQVTSFLLPDLSGAPIIAQFENTNVHAHKQDIVF